MQAVHASQPEARRARGLTRTAVSRLRVDTLRSLLDQLAADSRGNKDVLVQVGAGRVPVGAEWRMHTGACAWCGDFEGTWP